jgi:hypothetical protein
MALTPEARAANLREVYTALGYEPAKATYIASGNVTEPRNYVVPRCQLNVAQSVMVPPAAAGRLGVRSGPKYKVSLMPVARADPGTNTAVFLTAGVYDSSCRTTWHR